jgi:hypothetical protein
MRHWSDAEVETLTAMMKDGVPAVEIGAAIGRSESAVERKVERLRETDKARRRMKRPRRAAARAKRKCLTCGTMFKSESIGNRICDNCKENNRALGHLEGVAA